MMDELAEALGTIDRLRPFAWPPDKVTPPAAFVELPDITYDVAFARGAEQLAIEVVVVVSRVDSRSARDRVLQYPPLVKAAIEAHEPRSYDSARVVTAQVNHSYPLGAVEYLAYVFAIDIIGPGS